MGSTQLRIGARSLSTQPTLTRSVFLRPHEVQPGGQQVEEGGGKAQKII
jgi:hypothetical protein